ncbi:MAG: 5-(carboxyamino)imidazole ribonucleotide mutase [Alphaproteobacteria bacterium]|nr:5-(carboxyamino)imidazole ribonucleotide mutase [Alphaproteobacteria bacterium]
MPRSAKPKKTAKPLIGIVMGSHSDGETMRHAVEMLEDFKVPYEINVISAHRTPKQLIAYATSAASRGLKIIIAGAGGAAHLPGVTAALTHLPVLGVPVQSKTLDGLDSLLSIVQMPAGVPVGTLAIGRAGAVNAGLLAIAILALEDKELSGKLRLWRTAQMAAMTSTPKKKKVARKGKR